MSVDAHNNPVCMRPWTEIMLYYKDRKVECCCMIHKQVFGYVGVPKFGMTLMEVWNCEQAQHFRRAMLAGRVHKICQLRCQAKAEGSGILWGGGKGRFSLPWRQSLMDEDSPFGANLRLQEKEFAEGVTDLKSFPSTIELSWGSACNLKCVMCGHWQIQPAQKIMAEDLAAVKKLLPYIYHFRLLGGEPLFDKDCVQFIADFTKERYPHARLSVYTNGVLLNQRMLERFRDTSFYSISFSIDGSSKEVYEDTRVGANFEKVVANLKNAGVMGKKWGWDFTFRIHHCVSTRNFRELPKFPAFVRSLGEQFTPSICMMVGRPEEMLRTNPELHQEFADCLVEMESELVRLGFPKEIGQAQGKVVCGFDDKRERERIGQEVVRISKEIRAERAAARRERLQTESDNG